MSDVAHPVYHDAAYSQHFGGEQPVSDHAQVLPEYRGAQDDKKGVRITCAMAARLDWSHDGGPDDIVGYWLLFDPTKPPSNQTQGNR